MSELRLRARMHSQLESELRAAFPQECCGLIEGIRRDDFIEVSTLHAVRNIAMDADSFEIDPAEHIRILREARAAGREIVGCYHSHPNGRSDPSERDREQANEEGFVWLIAALSAPDAHVLLRAFVVSNGRFEPLAIGSVQATESAGGKGGLR